MKKAICALLLVLSIIIMLSGLTMSYFIDKSNEIQIPFTTGILEMEIVELPEDLENWVPGKNNALEIGWCFKNVGKQPAWLRVKIDGKWKPEVLADIAQWEQKNDGWNMRDDYYYLYEEPVYPNETVRIDFDVWLNMSIDSIDENYNSAEYTIKMTLEAAQEEW
ncbi:MAG: hypothetical protein GX213_04285 [Clostridiaceae bacterium]|nr:hypothetical protein [Clostridiaceae bacterium]